ncbi:NAD-dependent protein deacetylase sirtuin-2 [Smittium culicis]|uniref:NAD-dependent protein deacetylase sirtuin-2 n=1 Tax=Smittium culicis TaxID=133412 RepID=A0A1R1YI93_9FUNG|nr:NAD-dependent protein deacetylase sirtuin-2 [Smittium culicis]
MLKRNYTQNVDMLERLAGIDPDLIIEAHGSFASAHCINHKCKKPYSLEWVRQKMNVYPNSINSSSGNGLSDSSNSESVIKKVSDKISDESGSSVVGVLKKDDIDCNSEKNYETSPNSKNNEVDIPTCEICSDYVKPDIVFFGEQLPDRFHKLSASDLGSSDLVLIMGTSLKVYPFAGLVNLVREATGFGKSKNKKNSKSVPSTTRYLINNEIVGYEGQFSFINDPEKFEKISEKSRPNSGIDDYLYLGGCDDGCIELAKELGWDAELFELMKS